MDDDMLVERLNQLAHLAEEHVAAGTSDTGVKEITAAEADRIIAAVKTHGAEPALVIKVLQRISTKHRAAIEQAAKRALR